MSSKYLRLICIAALVVIFDQITKAIIKMQLPVHAYHEVLPGFFNIVHVLNPGGAFGFLADQGPLVRKGVFLLISGLAIFFVLYLYVNTPATHPLLASALALIFGGAVGNMIDRVRWGKVIDFLDCYIGKWHWPAFNVADSAITIGVSIFFYHIIFNKMPDE